MKTNTEGINIIKFCESLHDGDLKKIGLQPKMCPAGIWTEGYGRAMIHKGKFLKGNQNKELAFKLATISDEISAEKALKEDLVKFEKIVENKLKVNVNENQFSALVSHAYNTGGSNTLFQLINNEASDYSIRQWFENKYISANGVKLKGLINRRKLEANLYFKNA